MPSPLAPPQQEPTPSATQGADVAATQGADVAATQGADVGVGAVLRRLRTERTLSMRQLARLAGLSQPFLSNIENGRSMPSIATLYRLAEALDVSAQELLPATAGDVHASRAGRAAPSLRTSDAPDAPISTLVSGGPSQLIEVRRVSLPPPSGTPEWFEHHGEDFMFLLTGELTVEFGDGRAEHLRAGDSLWYRSTVRHRLLAHAVTGAEVLLVNARVPTSFSPLTAGTHYP
jgi:transcriptional regulator with XRE-family HTH domain